MDTSVLRALSSASDVSQRPDRYGNFGVGFGGEEGLRAPPRCALNLGHPHRTAWLAVEFFPQVPSPLRGSSQLLPYPVPHSALSAWSLLQLPAKMAALLGNPPKLEAELPPLRRVG